MSAKSVMKGLLPPVLVSGLRTARNRASGRNRHPQWEYVPAGWTGQRDDPAVRGWDVETVRDRYRMVWQRWLDALQGTGTLGVDLIRSLRPDVGDLAIPTDLAWAHNAVMSYAYVLGLAAQGRRHLSILDWGGGIGQFLPVSRALLPAVEFDYHCKDLPFACALGRELNPHAVFHEGDSWREARYDLVWASSALQYVEDWAGTLADLTSVSTGHLFVTRLPVVMDNPSFVVLQRAYDYGFDTEFLGWFLNRTEFLDQARDTGLELVREFVMMDETPVRNAPEQAIYRGFLFSPR
jgi:putative methyltransferase (TIGR04325 family)